MRPCRHLLRRAQAALVCTVVAIGLSGAAIAAEPTGNVVARIGGKDITAGALSDFVNALDPNVRKEASADPQLMVNLVRNELTRMAVLSEAKAKKWDERPEVVARIARAIDDAVVQSYLESVSKPPANYPSDAEVKSAYDLNRQGFVVPRQYRVAQIFVADPADSDKKADEAARKKADELARKAKEKPASFASIAQAESEDKGSAAKGGDLGWAPEDQILPEIRAKLAGMGPGEVSDPIRTDRGWHIIRMVDTKPAGARPLEEVRASLIAALRQRKTEEGEKAYLAGLLQKSPVSVNEAVLKKIFATAP